MKAMNPAHSAALAAWPVGSVYMSVNPTSPATLFGGTWQRIQGRFPLGADDAHPAGSTGGEEKVALTSENNGPHTHRFEQNMGAILTDQHAAYQITPINNGWNGQQAVSYETVESGLGKPHNNMPPYLSVYMWQRTA